MNMNSFFPIRSTLILLSYNQEHFLPEAIESCLNQICEPIEIILSDDASSDNSYSLMLEMANNYSGLHDVHVRRNPVNLGIGAHYNCLINEAKGDLIITAAGDDISMPDRVQKILDVWDKSGQSVDLIASNLIDISSSGEELGLIHVSDLSLWKKPEDWTKNRPYVVGASHAFTKRMHQYFGDFDDSIEYEDQVMAFRSTCLGGAITINLPLLKYRRGGVSCSSENAITSEQYLISNYKKFLRQKNTFSQIKSDMATANLENLWKGKVRNYLTRSDLALSIYSKNTLIDKILTVLKSNYAGGFWTLRQIINSQFPQIPTWFKNRKK